MGYLYLPWAWRARLAATRGKNADRPVSSWGGADVPSSSMRTTARDALLDAAFEALLDEGPSFGVASVARRAGASKALVFHHFGAREGLFDAMAARVLAQTQAGLDALADEHPHPRERLEAFARALLAEPAETPAQARHVLLFWLDGARAKVRDDLLADFVARTLAEARSRADAASVATRLLAAWHGATVLYASGRAVDLDAEAERLAAEIAPLVGR